MLFTKPIFCVLEKHFHIVNTWHGISAKTKESEMSVTQQPSRSQYIWCLSFLYYISMVATSYFIIARATLTPTPHSLLFISHRYTGQTERESMIKKSAAWFTTVWEAVKRSIVCTCVFLCMRVSAFLTVDYTTQEMKPLYAIQTCITSHNLALVCLCGCVCLLWFLHVRWQSYTSMDNGSWRSVMSRAKAVPSCAVCAFMYSLLPLVLLPTAKSILAPVVCASHAPCIGCSKSG